MFRAGRAWRGGFVMLAAACVAACVAALASVAAAADAPPPAPPSVPGYPGVGVFQMPQAAAAESLAESLIAIGRYAPAAKQLEQLTRAYPQAPKWRAMAAAAEAGLGDDAAAIAQLEDAVDLGFTDLFGLLGRPPMNRLAGDPRIAALADKLKPPSNKHRLPVARRIANGIGAVTAENAGWDATTGRISIFFAFPKKLRRLPMFGRPTEDPALQTLAALVRGGKAAGNAGDLYDNRDRRHSWLRLYEDTPTQLSHVIYDQAAQKIQLDYGMNEALLFNAPTFGNSSTALTGAFWRSQPRNAMTSTAGPMRLWQLYQNNHIYVFPEHHDFDPEAEGWHGDQFPAYLPYLIVTQGSSGSDRPYMTAIQAILAAFTPKTKAFLTERKLIAPTVQQIIRRSLKSARGRKAYLSARAHPTVFRGDDIDLGAAIYAAQAMAAGDVPPLTTIGVIDEPRLTSGVSFFGDALGERLFDTPAAIGRIWRGIEPSRRYLLKAAATDPNGRPVRFHWRLLRGAPEHVRIKPYSVDQDTVEVTIDWQDRHPPPERADLLSHRIDIAAFADNGVHISAPAIFSLVLPSHQTRVYENGPKGLRIKQVNYRKGPSKYADPRLWPTRAWIDTYRYDAAGVGLGWTRIRKGAKKTEFQPDGVRADGVKVRYPVGRQDGKPALAVTEEAIE